jgi:MoxR-like ATPase
MDCFLIQHCIWSEDSEKDAVYQFVRESVEKYGYTVSMDVSAVKKELENIDTDVKDWTMGEKEVSRDTPKGSKASNRIYYKFDNIYDGEYNELFEDEKNKLTVDQYTKCTLHTDIITHYNDRSKTMWIKLSGNENKVFLADKENPSENDCTEVSFETETIKESKNLPYIKHQTPATIKDWDKQINVVKNKTGNMKSQIEGFRSNELKHIHTNIFGNEQYVNIIENNLNEIKEQIELLEIEADRIHYAYHNIEEPDDKNIKLINKNSNSSVYQRDNDARTF